MMKRKMSENDIPIWDKKLGGVPVENEGPLFELLLVLRDETENRSEVEYVMTEYMVSLGFDRSWAYEWWGPRKAILTKIYKDLIKPHLKDESRVLERIYEAFSVEVTETLSTLVDVARDARQDEKELANVFNQYIYACLKDEEDNNNDTKTWVDEYWDQFVKPHLEQEEESRLKQRVTKSLKI